MSDLLSTSSLVIASIALIANTFVFMLFIATKHLRQNLFFRLLFAVFLYHSLSCFTILINQTYVTKRTNLHCVILKVIGTSCRLGSVTQLAIIAVDRFQATLPKCKSVILSRRKRLGIVSMIVSGFIFVGYLTVGLLFGTGKCTMFNGYGDASSYIRSVTAHWIVISIFFFEVPFLVATVINVKRTCKRIGVCLSAGPVLRHNEGSSNICVYPTPTVQQSIRQKVKALKILTILIATHVIIFVPQLAIMIVGEIMDTPKSILFNYGVLLQAVNFFIDPIVAMITVKQLNKCIITMFKCNY